jgi:2-polyprenyl-3-methyl-5-hydroxy-6-metoxy-1,4-benzoquinol methylase
MATLVPWLEGEERRRSFLSQYWYYAIELEPGVMTQGHRYPNVGLTRDFLAQIDLTGQRCLDIGTMEGLIPVVLKRRGAGQVVAIDGFDFSEKIAAVKAAYGVDFAYLPNVMASGLLDALKARHVGERAQHAFVGGTPPRAAFDVVVCSGVLYHVYSPIHVIGALRSALRPGGLLVLETAAIPLDAFVMQYNFAGTGYVFGPTDTWLPAIPLIDHLLRFMKFLPLDAAWFPVGSGHVRFACVARAVGHRPALPAEVLMDSSALNLEYDLILREDFARDEVTTPVQFIPSMPKPIYRPGVGSCDLYATMRARPAASDDPRRAELRLEDAR